MQGCVDAIGLRRRFGPQPQVRGGRRIETKGIPQTHLDASSAVILGLFQFMIGNTDWSVPGLHNIELVETATGDYLGVAYDYDWTGAIDARYAEPAATLGIRNVRQRLWRGWRRLIHRRLIRLRSP